MTLQARNLPWQHLHVGNDGLHFPYLLRLGIRVLQSISHHAVRVVPQPQRVTLRIHLQPAHVGSLIDKSPLEASETHSKALITSCSRASRACTIASWRITLWLKTFSMACKALDLSSKGAQRLLAEAPGSTQMSPGRLPRTWISARPAGPLAAASRPPSPRRSCCCTLP